MPLTEDHPGAYGSLLAALWGEAPPQAHEGDDLAEWGYEAAMPHLTQTGAPQHEQLAD